MQGLSAQATNKRAMTTVARCNNKIRFTEGAQNKGGGGNAAAGYCSEFGGTYCPWESTPLSYSILSYACGFKMQDETGDCTEKY